MSCCKDEMHLLEDFSKAAKIIFRTLDDLRKFAEIINVRDDTDIIQ